MTGGRGYVRFAHRRLRLTVIIQGERGDNNGKGDCAP